MVEKARSRDGRSIAVGEANTNDDVFESAVCKAVSNVAHEIAPQELLKTSRHGLPSLRSLCC